MRQLSDGWPSLETTAWKFRNLILYAAKRYAIRFYGDVSHLCLTLWPFSDVYSSPVTKLIIFCNSPTGCQIIIFEAESDKRNLISDQKCNDQLKLISSMAKLNISY